MELLIVAIYSLGLLALGAYAEGKLGDKVKARLAALEAEVQKLKAL